jgi:hypothetical protein
MNAAKILSNSLQPLFLLLHGRQTSQVGEALPHQLQKASLITPFEFTHSDQILKTSNRNITLTYRILGQTALVLSSSIQGSIQILYGQGGS